MSSLILHVGKVAVPPALAGRTLAAIDLHADNGEAARLVSPDRSSCSLPPARAEWRRPSVSSLRSSAVMIGVLVDVRFFFAVIPAKAGMTSFFPIPFRFPIPFSLLLYR
jgi:hypothetical protein